VFTFVKASKNFKVEVDVQKGALRFREEIDNRCASFIQMSFVLRSNYYELYPMDESNVQQLSHWKVKVAYT